MRSLRAAAAVTLAASMAAGITGCGGGTSAGGSNDAPETLTYWASNQGPSIEADQKILTPELKKFEKQTGIKVKLEVIPWSDLLNRILAATTSGQGPDVLNIGNTWSASLQATGALLPWDKKNFDAIGGQDRFVESAVASAGAKDQPPAAVPLYSLAYALYYNKKMFADAGITQPPATWDQLVADGKKISKDGKWGLGAEGANLSNNIHQVFVLGRQHDADFFDASGKATFTSDGAVAAVKQYIDFMATDKIIAPGNAEYAQNQSLTDFAKGRTAMVLWQAAGGMGMGARTGSGGHARHRHERQLHGRRDQHGGVQEHQEHRRRQEVRQIHDEQQGAGAAQQDVRIDSAGQGGPAGRDVQRPRPEGPA